MLAGDVATVSGKNEPRYLDGGGRLAAPPAVELVRAFGHELAYAQVLFEGISYADIAHTVMLIEQGIAPEDDGGVLLEELVAMHDRGLEGLDLDAKWGDLYNNRDAELQSRLGDRAGWLHAGRARREALTLAWLIHLRSAVADLLKDLIGGIDRIVAVCETHRESIMPDFTYLQHAHPTSLGHYLLGFVFPLMRDAERLSDEWNLINESPAGSASTNGSRLPLDRERMCQLLGFAKLNEHNRDAMWRSDVPIHTMAVLVSLVTTASKLAEELQVWCTEEFGFVELADQHCRTSVIMPNKKNPYALTFMRGQAREMDGNLVSVIATNQTPSGQIDNRNTSYNLLPRAIATARDVVNMLADVLEGATFDLDRMRQQAASGFTFATELTDILLEKERVDSRRAHEIVGSVVAAMGTDAIDQSTLRVALEKAFEESTGRALAIDVAEVFAELAPERIVAGRRGRGSCGAAAMDSMFEQLARRCRTLEGKLNERLRQGSFPARIRDVVGQRLGRKW